jgi:putative glutamine amidotransferase
MTRPLIGITTEVAAAIWRDRIREAVLSPAACAAAVERAGGQPVLLPPTLPVGPGGPRGNDGPGAPSGRAAQLDRAASRLIRVLDGVLLRAGPQAVLGGAPMAGQPVRPEVAAVAPQAALIRAAVDSAVPFLAVGAGLLALNLVTGGTLDTEPPGPGPGGQGARNGGAARTIELTADSALAGLLETKSVTITARRPGRTTPLGGSLAPAPARSSGRLRLGRLGRGLTAAGHGAGQAVLAVEATGHPFGIGVAWHPEEGDDPRLLAGLLAAAGRVRRPAVQPA